MSNRFTARTGFYVALAVALALFVAADAYAQVSSSGGFVIIRAYDGTNVINVGDNANSALRVNVVAGSGAGVSHVDDAAFTVASDDIVPAGAMFDDTSPDSVNEGDAGVVRMSANRNLYTTLRDAAGSERGANVTAGNALVVDASATTQPVSATDLDIRNLTATDVVTVTDGAGALNVIVDSTTAFPSSASANNDGAQVSVTTTSGTVLASFSTRKFAMVCSSPLNTAVVHLKLAATATTADGKLHVGQCWNTGPTPYTGVIDGIAASGTQEVTVWEW